MFRHTLPSTGLIQKVDSVICLNSLHPNLEPESFTQGKNRFRNCLCCNKLVKGISLFGLFMQCNASGMSTCWIDAWSSQFYEIYSVYISFYEKKIRGFLTKNIATRAYKPFTQMRHIFEYVHRNVLHFPNFPWNVFKISTR